MKRWEIKRREVKGQCVKECWNDRGTTILKLHLNSQSKGKSYPFFFLNFLCTWALYDYWSYLQWSCSFFFLRSRLANKKNHFLILHEVAHVKLHAKLMFSHVIYLFHLLNVRTWSVSLCKPCMWNKSTIDYHFTYVNYKFMCSIVNLTAFGRK